MRSVVLKVITWKLKIIAKLFLFRYKPKIIGITGSVGKSSAKEAVYAVLRSNFRVRRSLGSYNNEIGVPLTILGEESPGANFFGWLAIFFKSAANLIYDKDYPKILVLELGVDRPGDLEYLLSFIKPNLAIITSISPVHLEKMKTEAEILKEKSKLAAALSKKGTAILNFDDPKLRELGLKLKNKVIFYGLSGTANIYASEIKCEKLGISFNINYAGSVVPAAIPVFGKAMVYAVLAASAVGVSLGMDLVNVTSKFKNIKGLKGRLKLFKGKKKATIIDDSYNSSPIAARLALSAAGELREEIKARRLVVVLGDMLELGEISRRAHINLGREAANAADLVIAVGKEAKNIQLGAELTKEKDALWFPDSSAVAAKILGIIKKGDLILIKGSQGVRMEKITEVMLKNKKDIKKLPRMGGYWKNK